MRFVQEDDKYERITNFSEIVSPISLLTAWPWYAGKHAVGTALALVPESQNQPWSYYKIFDRGQVFNDDGYDND